MNKQLLILIVPLLFIVGCQGNSESDAKVEPISNHENVIRIGQIVKVKPEYVEQYQSLHADSNPGVRHLLKKYNMRNFSIYLEQFPDGNWYEFGYYEYWGDDFEGDMAKLDAEPENIKWLEMCDPMQEGISEGQNGWKQMKRVYFNY